MMRETATPESVKRMLPPKLLGQNRWTVWVKNTSGKPSLYQPSEQQVIAATPGDPYTWDSIDEAIRALLYNPHFATRFAEGGAGIAYVNSHATPLATITLYGAVLKDRKVAPWALRYLDLLDAYAEEGMVPGSLVFLWEGPLEPVSKAGVSVAQPAVVALTLRKIPGSPSRVGTAKTRYARFLEMVDEAAQRFAERLSGRFAEYGPEVAQAMAALVQYGLRPRGERRWYARCPSCQAPKPTLSVALEERLYLSCSKGCTPQEVVAALGVPWNEAHFSPKPLREEALPPVLEDRALEERVERAYLLYFSAPENHPLLLRYGISHDVGLEYGLGLEGAEGGHLLVPSYLRYGEPGKHLLGLRVYDAAGDLVEQLPPEGAPWVSPGYEEAEAFVVTDHVLTALALANILSKDPRRRWGVVAAPEGVLLPTAFLRKGKTKAVYLWPYGGVRFLQGWREALASFPYEVYLVPAGEVPFGGNRAEVAQAVQGLLKEAERI